MGIEEIILTVAVIFLGAILILSVWRLVLLLLVHARQKDLLSRMEALERRLRKSSSPQASTTPAAAAAETPSERPRESGSPRRPGEAAPDHLKTTPETISRESPKPPPRPKVVAPREPAAAADASSPPRPPRSPQAPPAQPEPREPGPVAEALHRVEEAALLTLRKVWNWIVVGEEHRDSTKTVEYAVATTWLVRIGVLLIVVGIGFGFAYSFENNLIHEGGRVVLGVLAGIAMIAGGLRLLGKRYHLLGQGLIGGGLAILYITVFAAHHFYGLVASAWVAFALMGLVTAAAGVLAVSVNSLLIAILGIMGGYITPFVLSGSGAGYGSFFGYLLVLGLGIAAIAHFRRWILLNYLGMAFTYVHVLRALASHYRPSHFTQVMLFLVLFFALYSAVVIVYNVMHRQRSNLIEIFGLFANSAVFFGVGQWLIRQSYDHRVVALLTLMLAAFYVVLVYAFLRRHMTDRTLLFTLMALAGFYVALTMPLALSRQWLTVSWAVQAFVMLWLSRKVNSRFLQALSCVLYALVVFRLFAFDMAGAFQTGSADQPLVAYLLDLCERLVVFGVPVASFMGAWQLHRTEPDADAAVTVAPEADSATLIADAPAMGLFIAAAVLAVFVYLHLELNRMFGVLFDPLRLPVITGLWVILAAALVMLRKQGFPRRWARVLIYGSVAVIVIKLFVVDLQSWGFSPDTMRFAADYSWIEAAMRLLDFGIVVGLAGWLAYALREDGRRAMRVFVVLALSILFVFLTLETNSFLHTYLVGFKAGGLSILWSAFALALVIQGIRRRVRPLRYCGLALFAIVFLKVFFIDLAHLTALYRMVALVIMGIIILLGSLIYLRNAESFAHRDDKETSE